MIKSITFSHKGQEYEVRWALIGETYRIQAFKDGRAANGYEYSVALPIALAMANSIGVSAIENLIETAKRDVIEERWERFLKAVADLKAEEDRLNNSLADHR